jgi:hypothetical protein
MVLFSPLDRRKIPLKPEHIPLLAEKFAQAPPRSFFTPVE